MKLLYVGYGGHYESVLMISVLVPFFRRGGIVVRFYQYLIHLNVCKTSIY